METIMYIVVLLCIVLFIMFLLPVILPIVLIGIIAIAVYIWYLRRKMLKQLEEDEEIVYTFESENQNPSDTIIDVEYSEHEAEE